MMAIGLMSDVGLLLGGRERGYVSSRLVSFGSLAEKDDGKASLRGSKVGAAREKVYVDGLGEQGWVSEVCQRKKVLKRPCGPDAEGFESCELQA